MVVVKLTNDLHLKKATYKDKPCVIYVRLNSVYVLQDYYGNIICEHSKKICNTHYNRIIYIGSIGNTTNDIKLQNSLKWWW